MPRIGGEGSRTPLANEVLYFRFVLPHGAVCQVLCQRGTVDPSNFAGEPTTSSHTLLAISCKLRGLLCSLPTCHSLPLFLDIALVWKAEFTPFLGQSMQEVRQCLGNHPQKCQQAHGRRGLGDGPKWPRTPSLSMRCCNARRPLAAAGLGRWVPSVSHVGPFKHHFYATFPSLGNS